MDADDRIELTREQAEDILGIRRKPGWTYTHTISPECPNADGVPVCGPAADCAHIDHGCGTP